MVELKNCLLMRRKKTLSPVVIVVQLGEAGRGEGAETLSATPGCAKFSH